MPVRLAAICGAKDEQYPGEGRARIGEEMLQAPLASTTDRIYSTLYQVLLTDNVAPGRSQIERREQTIEGPIYEGSSVEGSSLEGSSLEGSSLEGPKLEGPKLEGPKLEGSIVKGPI